MFICSCAEDSFMQRKRKKSHVLRNVLVAVIVFIVIVSVVVAEYELRGTGPPAYSAVSTTSTNAGTACTFSALWSDSVNLSGYIFGSNNTGVFVNDTWTPFSGGDFLNQTSAYSSVTETLDSNLGDVVNWGFWCNGTGNHWSSIPLQTLYVTSDFVLLNITEETNPPVYLGNITIQLFADEPITSANFKNLTSHGWYDGTTFSRIAPGFVIQGGDITASHPGINIANITDELPTKHSNVLGTVSMAKEMNNNSAYVLNSASDQFFINLADNSASLDANFTVFGMVVSGMNVVDAISQLVPSGSAASGYSGAPSVTVTITTAVFVNDPD